MLDDRRALPRVLTPALAARLGVTRSARRHAIRAYGWRPLACGAVLTRDEEPQRDDWATLGLLLAGPAAALSGWDAARSHGAGGRQPPSATVLVLDRSGTNRRVGPVLIRPTRRPYRMSLLPPEHPTLPYAPIVAAARAVADTALQLTSFVPARALVTGAVQRGCCTPADLVAELEAGPRGGSRWLRRALEDVMVNARSVAEAEAVDLLRGAGVPSFELNVPVMDPSGHTLAVLDILFRAQRAVLEIDSREYHFTAQDWQATLARHNRLTRLGLAVEHHAPSVIRARRRTWAAGVRTWLQARSRELGVPFVPGDGPLRGTPTPLHVARQS